MKIGLITTLQTNIGDDFIRLGIQNVLRQIYAGKKIDWVLINKHDPESVWPKIHPMRWLPEWAPNWRRVAKNIGFSRFDGCDLIVQCGAPVIWNGCSNCEWNEPIWQTVIRRLHKRIPVLNLAAGSSFPLSKLPVSLERETDQTFLRSILSYCQLTTARDALSAQLFCSVNPEGSVPNLPCTAGLAFEPTSSDEGKYVVVNYMEKGGHFDFLNDIDGEKWEKTFRAVLDKIADTFPIRFLCHNEAELRLCKRVFPEYEGVLPESPEAYVQLARNCRLGIFNRLHAAVAYAGMGIPSVSVGNDSRVMMLEEYGLPYFDVRKVDSKQILDAFDVHLKCRDLECKRLLELRQHNLETYISLLRTVLIES